MYVFIDDSGDPGFKFDKGSSRFFVIACCVFETAEAAESASAAISDLKERLGRPQHVEFKFAKTRLDTQVQFFDTLSREDFFIRVLVIDKLAHASFFHDRATGSLYNEAIERVLSGLSFADAQSSITIDGGGSKQYRQAVTAQFSRVTRSDSGSSSRKVKFVASDGNFLIQLADMVAGCSRRGADPGDPRAQQYTLILRPITSNPNSEVLILR